MTYEWQIFELREGYDQDRIRHFLNSFKYDRTYKLASVWITDYEAYCMTYFAWHVDIDPHFKTLRKYSSDLL